MKKFIAFSFVFILIFSTATAQHTCIKLIEKNKFSKVEKKIEKVLKKSPDDIVMNLMKGILYSARQYKDYNTDLAYKFVVKSKNEFEKINDPKEIQRLDKVPVNKSVYLSLIDTISHFALDDAIKINTISNYEHYISYYKLAPKAYTQTAISKRDILAYEIACEKNTVESFQHFIDTYPDAIQIYDATKKRNKLAYEKTKSTDSIEAYREFIKKYPSADEVAVAHERIHEIAFENAKSINTSSAYKGFVTEYPNSKQYKQAYSLYEYCLLKENTSAGDWRSFLSFIEDYPKNSFRSQALDSIYSIGIKRKDRLALENYFSLNKSTVTDEQIISFYKIFTQDGEVETLNLFFRRYYHLQESVEEFRSSDYETARKGQKINLTELYKNSQFKLYDEYIKDAGGKERAFVALQRMIASDIASKSWQNAISKINKYLPYFGKNDAKVQTLVELLKKPWDYSVKIMPLQGNINSVDGDEYVPVISADNKSIYFCGRNRKDNIGGEDIFISRFENGRWSQPQLITSLSKILGNEAPLSISADGTMLLVFNSGTIHYAEKTISGWSRLMNFPSHINEGSWQADAMISSDGKALIFASVRDENYNLYEEEPYDYHGAYDYPADIYVSLLQDNNTWGPPINMGNTINTPYCDRSPFLHPDMKTLYFSSDGHGGLGNLDLYMSTRLHDSCWTCWSEPINLGKEVNSPEKDWGYKISTDGEKAYFAKNVSGKNQDLYYLTLPPHLRPDYVATVTGKILDSDENPVSTQILWEDLESGKNVGQSNSNPEDGTYFIVLPLGKIYGYYIVKEGVFPSASHIDLRNTKEPVEVAENISIVTFDEMIEEGIAVPVNNLFFNFAESKLLPQSIPELKRLAIIIKEYNLKIEIAGHTDNIGTEEQNLILSEKRAIAVKEFLVAQGCMEESLSIVGYGFSKPIATNDTEQGRAKNRRVEIRFIE